MGNGKGNNGGEASMAVDFSALPEGCIAHILSFISPQDVCRLSLLSSAFRSAAESDAVWDCFIPSEFTDEISQIVPSYASKKKAYFHLCHHPILIHGATKSFWMDKKSGKKSYMLSPRDLFIVWSENPAYWRWLSTPEARFPEVVELLNVCWLEIRGKFDTAMLSPATSYAAYLVFKPSAATYGFQHQPVEAAVGLAGTNAQKQTVYLEAAVVMQGSWLPPRLTSIRGIGRFNVGRGRVIGTQETMLEPVPSPADENRRCQWPAEREDGWSETKLGEFFYDGAVAGDLEISVLEVKGGNWKSGILVQGIEIRPQVLKSK